VFGYDKVEDPKFGRDDVQSSFLKALSDMTTVSENQIEISTEAYDCQIACTGSAGNPNVGVIVKVVITTNDATEQAAVEQAVEDLTSADTTHDGETCCKPEFKALFSEELANQGVSPASGYSLSSVGSPEYSAGEEEALDTTPTPAPDAGGGGPGMIIGGVVAVVLVAAAGVLVYKQKTKKAVVSRVEKKPKGGMIDNPMSLGDVYGNAGDPDGVVLG
jgi:hypothetical protein